jgi:hypothetical protein
VLLALWSPKGGSGTSVFAAACALVLGRRGGARLADLDGDQPALFGLASDPPTGLVDWLGAGPEAPTDALERLTVEAAAGVALIPRGSPARPLAPVPAAEAGAALAIALRDGLVPTVVDLGLAQSPAARAVLEVADASLVVVRGCYLTLRRAVRAAPLATAGVVHVAEPGAIGRHDVAGVLTGQWSPRCRCEPRSPPSMPGCSHPPARGAGPACPRGARSPEPAGGPPGSGA